jgi:hypothetical protein
MSTDLLVLLVVFLPLGVAPAAVGSYAVVQRASALAQLAWFAALALGIAATVLAAVLALVRI